MWGKNIEILQDLNLVENWLINSNMPLKLKHFNPVNSTMAWTER